MVFGLGSKNFYSFDNFLHDIDVELLGLVGKTTDDFVDYEFEADYHS